MDQEHAQQQLDTLEHARRRIGQRLDRPTLLVFALGVFLSFALKQFGERTEVLSMSVLPILIAAHYARTQATASRRMPLRSIFLVLMPLLLWVLLFNMLGNWNPAGWPYLWPAAGLLAAAPLVLLAWTRKS